MQSNSKPKVILLAYGQMAPYAFRSLIQHFTLSAIVTPPLDSKLYRSSDESLVEKLARRKRIEVLRTNTNSEIEKYVKKAKPAALVICSYNKILPSSLIPLVPCINVHHGDLPRWRGRANLNWAIITGRKSVGLTIHEAVPELDAGPIYVQHNIPISPTETIETLYEKVNKFVEENLGKTVQRILNGYKGKPQRGKATYCCTRLPQDGNINWSKSSVEIDRIIRGLKKPFPGAFTYLGGEKMTIWNAEIPKNPRNYEGRIPGRVSLIHKNQGVEILTGDSSLIISTVTYRGIKKNASDIIRSTKTTLGLDFTLEYEKLKKAYNRLHKKVAVLEK